MWDTVTGLAILAGVVLFFLVAAVVANVRHPKTPTSPRPGSADPRAEVGTNRIPYHCATFGHAFVRRYSDRWRCAKCGVLSDIVPTDLGDGAA